MEFARFCFSPTASYFEKYAPRVKKIVGEWQSGSLNFTKITEQHLAELEHALHTVYVLDFLARNNEIIAFSSLKKSDIFENTSLIDPIFVTQSRRNYGLTSYLIEQMIIKSKELGFMKVSANVKVGTRTYGLLLEKFGFVPVVLMATEGHILARKLK